MLEHIIHTNMMQHLEVETHSLLNDEQHGFRKGRSCETQLALTVNDLAKILDTSYCIQFGRKPLSSFMKCNQKSNDMVSLPNFMQAREKCIL